MLFRSDHLRLVVEHRWGIVEHKLEDLLLGLEEILEVDEFGHAFLPSVDFEGHFELDLLGAVGARVGVVGDGGEQTQRLAEGDRLLGRAELHRVRLVHLHGPLPALRLLRTPPEDRHLHLHAFGVVQLQQRRLEEEAVVATLAAGPDLGALGRGILNQRRDRGGPSRVLRVGHRLAHGLKRREFIALRAETLRNQALDSAEAEFRSSGDPTVFAKKAYRYACHMLTRQAGIKIDPDARPLVSIEFVPPNRRPRDWDGCLAAIKAGLDGVADAIGCDDSRWRLEISMAPDGVIGGMVRVQVTT